MQNAKQSHWDAAYEAGDSVSWFQQAAKTSLELIDSTRCEADAAIVDIGGGSSTLVDGLVASGYSDVTVLDVSPNSLAAARARLGDRAQRPHWIVADLLDWDPVGMYEIWHDRAVLHFLTDQGDRERYRAAVGRAVSPGGHVVIGVFRRGRPEHVLGA